MSFVFMDILEFPHIISFLSLVQFLFSIKAYTTTHCGGPEKKQKTTDNGNNKCNNNYIKQKRLIEIKNFIVLSSSSASAFISQNYKYKTTTISNK
jgi:hypothetical protein